jgi:hypothetical protein
MPNWCNNIITIEGSDESIITVEGVNESIEHIWNVIHADDDLNLMGLRPLPEGKENNGTAINLWGTKWSLDIYSIDRYTAVDGTDSIHIQAMSAWSPPIELLRYITEQFTDVRAGVGFREEGMDFCGYAVCHSGMAHISEGSISENLPEGFDYDGDDAHIALDDTIMEMIDNHEVTCLNNMTTKEGV